MRILIVDDSALIRSIIKSFLELAGDLVVAGEASNGQQAITMNRDVAPDCIIMDIKMPIMDGLEATRRIMRDRPVPILIFSTEVDAAVSYDAMARGAIDVMRKPSMNQFNNPEFYELFLQKLRSVAQSTIHPALARQAQSSQPHAQVLHDGYGLVVIGASTGGPVAVRDVLSRLPANFPYGIGLVQHLEQGFDQGYAHWLDEATPLAVRLVDRPEPIAPGTVLVAPVDSHLRMRHNSLCLDDGPRVLFQKPSVDVLFTSAAQYFGKRVLGVLLTGMGRDGAAGCLAIVEQGGLTLVQDEATSAIFGMPKAAIEAGGASLVLPLQDIGDYLANLAP